MCSIWPSLVSSLVLPSLVGRHVVHYRLHQVSFSCLFFMFVFKVKMRVIARFALPSALQGCRVWSICTGLYWVHAENGTCYVEARALGGSCKPMNWSGICASPCQHMRVHSRGKGPEPYMIGPDRVTS
jgi:hypothetical protein